jgi:cephalosporin hydroxylase
VVPSSLNDMYAQQCATASDIYQHLPTLVELVKETDAQHVIELGTRTGVSTIAWLYGLEQTGGRLTSIDIDARPAIGEWDRWTFIQGDDTDPNVYSDLEPAEIVFIDTSHHYQHTRTELRLYRWLVKPGGLIVLHDTELPWPEGADTRDGAYPVKRAVTEFCQEYGYEFRNYTNCFGLGIVRVV